MKKLFSLTLFLSFAVFYTQQIHVRYLKVLSPYTSTHEDLYIKNNNIISIQDSVIIQNKLTSEWSMGINLDNGKKPSKQYYISDINNDVEKDFFFTSGVELKDFFIYDRVPKPEWKIDESQTKKILGYTCTKATTNFRGTNVTAFFAKDLPYSAGPFKFYGLPGLVLDIRADNKDHEIWKAESINIDDKKSMVYKPQFLNKEKISMKEYVEIKEESMNKIFSKVRDQITSAGGKINVTTNQRFTVEQKYEWETETGKNK